MRYAPLCINQKYLVFSFCSKSFSPHISEQGEIERWVGGVDKKKMTKEISQATKQARDKIKKQIND